MNNSLIKKLRKQYRKSINHIATKNVKSEIFRLARQRDIFGVILILENIVLVTLFFIFILPLLGQ